jgi:DNA mismatch repair protein MutS
MMSQWARCKEQAGDAVLFFRLGDFYEAFEGDAILVSKALDLTLTKRQGTPMCGIPWHASETYIDRLLVKGFSIAIAEQISPQNDSSKQLMERQIVRILTPSTAMKGSLVQDSSHSFFASISLVKNRWGIALVDVSTALFLAFEADDTSLLLQELSRLQPREILCSQLLVNKEAALLASLEQKLSLKRTVIPQWPFDLPAATTILQNHFGTVTLDGFGLDVLPAATSAAGALISHIKDTLLVPTCHIKKIDILAHQKTMQLDKATLSNLNIFETSSKVEHASSLYDLLNHTSTPMGARLLRSWLLHPLLDISAISARQDMVSACLQFIENEPTHALACLNALTSIRDLERLILRIQTGGAGPRDMLFFAHCYSHIPDLKTALQSLQHEPFREKIASLDALPSLVQQIRQFLVDEPPVRLTDGDVIRNGVNAQLDELRAIKESSSQWLLSYQTKLRDELEIKTLKVSYTRAFGYYIEVSRGQSEKVPPSFCRRQTLTGVERYISEELKEYEDKVLTAEKRIEALEASLFGDLCTEILRHVDTVIKTAALLAELDVYITFAQTAIKHRYVRPTIVDEPILEIVEGRHPIAEAQANESPFVPNDLHFSATSKSLFLITGPNMAGKSTYIRQAALLVIMAQIGSFLPAKSASIGIVDKVFSRIGASDDLFRGQSTFMVEMAETAFILNRATSRSLILLDEIGRGTGTYDGISIAWAVIEYLLRHPRENPRTLFATHYYELTALEQSFPALQNMTVAVSECPSGIRFLYTIIPGKTDRSYGIHVAKLAGLPQSVVHRAEEILQQFEQQRQEKKTLPKSVQQDLFLELKTESSQEATACLEFLKSIDLAKTTPIDCFMKIIRFKQKNAL